MSQGISANPLNPLSQVYLSQIAEAKCECNGCGEETCVECGENCHDVVEDSKYGYAAGEIYSLSLSALFKPNKKLQDWGLIGISSGIFLLHNGNGYWNGFLDPSSNSTMLIPSIGAIWKTGQNSISLNIQKPMLIKGIGIGSENALNNEFDAIELTIGYRYTLDYVIPWLYF